MPGCRLSILVMAPDHVCITFLFSFRIMYLSLASFSIASIRTCYRVKDAHRNTMTEGR